MPYPYLSAQEVEDAKSAREPSVRMVRLSPQIALKLLDQNVSNFRSASAVRIQQYSEDMRSGAWRDGVSLVSLDVNGEMNNGQHVCGAIVQTGISQVVIFGSGYAADAADAFDTGLVRTKAQVVKHHGVSDPGLAASTWRHYAAYKGRSRTSDIPTVPTASIMDRMEGDSFFIGNIEAAAGRAKALKSGGSNISAPIAAMVYLLVRAEHGECAADKFFDGLRGIDTPKEDPRFKAREALGKRGALAGSQGEFATKAILITAFNKWYQGVPVSQYRLPARLPELVKS